MLSHILIMVMCVQVLHVVHMHSLRLAPQCPTFHQDLIYLLGYVWADMWLVVGKAHLAKEIPNLVKTFHENKCLTGVSQRRMAKVDLCKSKSHGIQ